MRENYYLKKLRKSLYAAFCCIFLLLFSLKDIQARGFYSPAADKKITGKITDDKGAPLSNVSVLLKGTKKGVTTDLNGVFFYFGSW